MVRTWSVILAFVACFEIVLPFNLDVKDPFIYQGGSGDYFGYAVALHASQRSGSKWVVVGAPLGNKTSPSREHNRYGSVYKCNSDSTTCNVITIDNSRPSLTRWTDENGIPHDVNLEEKTGQWLGATVISSSQNHGPLLACAPRYALRGVVRAGEKPDDRKRLTLGKCFMVDDDLSGVARSTIQPCYHDDTGYSREYKETIDGLCQAGFSAAMSRDGTVMMGAPGRYLVNGSVSIYYPDTLDHAKSSPLQVLDSFSSGNAMGYAVATGHFKSLEREEFIASSPRAENLQGKVMAFDVDVDNFLMSVSFTLPSPKNVQMGSNFGQSLCAVDLNNDKYSDLLVGAPYHRHKHGDEGRVYVYVNNGKSPGTLNHKESMSLDGRKTKGALFGYAMAVAGDLNRDGFTDVAISAPYGGKDQGGVVFIYFGTKDGIDTSIKQVIEASDISPGVKTFGFSLAGNLDVDNNGYPDLAVGAYSSDKAFLLRSRPIVDMDGKIILSTTHISLEDNKTMRFASDSVSRKSIDVTVCLKYDNQSQSLGMPNVTFSVALDRDRKTSEHDFRRMFFFQGNKTSFNITRQVTLTKEKEWHCQFFDTAFLREKEQLQDVFDPLTFDLEYDLAQSPSCTLCPILNNYNDIKQRSFRAKAGFIKQCGNDKVCQPDLSVKGQVIYGNGNQSELLIGDVKEITVRVVVENKEPDAAYPGAVIVTYPSIIDYASSQDVSCSTNAGENGDRKAECTVANPFRGNVKKQFDIIFNTQRVTGKITEFTIHLEATSGLSEDMNLSNNEVTLSVPVKFEADLNIKGFSNPDQVVYGDKVSEVKNADDIGPTVRQTITVRNNGPSPVEYAEVTIQVPFKYNKEGESNYLLYLMEVQVLGNAGSCNVKTNPLNLQLTTNSSQVDQETSSSAAKTRREEQSSVELPCKSDSDMMCLKFPCYLGRMRRGDHVKIQMMSRLWQNTLIEAKVGSVILSTTAEVVPPSSVTEHSDDDNMVKIRLTANPRTTPKSENGKVAVWIIIVSVLGGLLLFGLAGFALYRFGFFKRKRHNKDEATEEEMTPMRTLETSAQDNGKSGPVHV